jgi:hypothetical protein
MDDSLKKTLAILGIVVGSVVLIGFIRRRRELYSSENNDDHYAELHDFFRNSPVPTDEEWDRLSREFNMDMDELGDVYADFRDVLVYEKVNEMKQSTDNPSDADWDRLAKELGMGTGENLRDAYDIISDIRAQGYSSPKTDRNAKFAEQMKKGVEVEREHRPTIDKIKASVVDGKITMSDEEIFSSVARDHLGEFDDYYDWLDRMEKAAKRGRPAPAESWLAGDGKSGRKLDAESFGGMWKSLKSLPVPDGWVDYYNEKIWPRMRKMIKALIIAGGVMSPVILAGLVTKKVAGMKYKGIGALDRKSIGFIRDVTRDLVGRVITLAGVFLANDRDPGRTVGAVKSVFFSAVSRPEIDIDWDKVDENKLLQAALFFADDTANVATAGGTVAASPTGVGAVIGAAVTGGTAAATMGTDIYAFKLIADAIGPGLDLKNAKKDFKVNDKRS